MHVHGVPCAAILVLLYIWKDLRVCLALESFCAGYAGLPSTRHQRNGMSYLVLVYLLCCCGACLRRSLRCHTCDFIHLERFDGLSCARKPSRRLRRFALGSSKGVNFRRPDLSTRQLGEPTSSQFKVHFEYYSYKDPEAGRPNPLCYRNRGHVWQRTHTDPEVGRPNPLCYGNRGEARQRTLRLDAPTLFATRTEGRPDKGLTLTLRLVAPTLFPTATEGSPDKGP